MRALGSIPRIERTLLAATLALVVSACADSAPTAPSESPDLRRARGNSGNATVYVVHGINGRDIGAAEALPVDVSLNGACALPGFTFRQIAGPLAIPAGTYNIQVRLANPAAPCTGPVAINAPGVGIAAGSNISIVAHLTAGGAPTASVFSNASHSYKPTVIARHTAAFSAVDVLVNRRVAFANVTNGQQGVANLRPARTRLSINVAGTNTEVWQASLVLRPFNTYIAYAVGTPSKGTFEVLLQRIAKMDRGGDDDDDDEDSDDDSDDDSDSDSDDD